MAPGLLAVSLTGCLTGPQEPVPPASPGAQQQAALAPDSDAAAEAAAEPVPLPRRKPEHLRGLSVETESLRRGDDLVSALPLPAAPRITLQQAAQAQLGAQTGDSAALPPLALEEIETLVGTSFASVEAALGAPATSEVRAPAEIWTYGGGDCALLLYFYPAVADKRYRLLAYQIAGAEDSPEGQRACAMRLLDQKAKAQPALPLAPDGFLEEPSQTGPEGAEPLRP